MSQLSFSSFDTSLMVRDAQGRYLLATADQILEAARQAIEHKMQRGASFTSPAAVKEYLCAKLAGFEHEVFAVLFLVSSDTQFHALWRHPDLRTPGLVEDQLRAVPSVASRSLSR